MNRAGRELCRFCLKIMHDQNFEIVGDTTLENLSALLIKIDFGIDGKCLICRHCQDVIEKCFNFKTTCLYSEDIITKYITKGSKLDLEEVYSKQILHQTSNQIPIGHKICRLCIKMTAKYLTITDEVFALTNNKVHKFIPELNLNVVKHPVICEACLMDLQSYSEFVASCLDVEKKINRYCEAIGRDKRQVQLYDVVQFTLNEESDISKCTVARNAGYLDEDQPKIGANCTEPGIIEFKIKTEANDVESEDRNIGCSGERIDRDIKTELCIGGQLQYPEADKFIQSDNINCDNKTYDLVTEDKPDMLSLSRMIKWEDENENQLQLSTKHNFMDEVAAQIYPKNEEIEIKSEGSDISDTMTYESQDNTLLQNKSHKNKYNKSKQISKKSSCKRCSSGYCDKFGLTTDKLCFHGVDPEVRLYECDQCSFITTHSRSLTKHTIVHKNISELKMYVCKECEFKTKYKHNIKRHLLALHQGSEVFSEVLVLNKHVPTHKSNSEVDIYSCNLCSYKTKFKRHLHYHEMTHKDKSELSTYDCFHCPYKAKRKTHLRRHMIRHKSPSQLISCQDSTSNFVTRDESWVSSHLSVHKDQSETELYCCAKCIFTTRHKRNLKNHMLIHMDSSELRKYKCAICPYLAKSRRYLLKHTAIHPEVEHAPIKVYKCMYCSFQTSSRSYFKEHLYVHNDKSFGEMPMLKCLLCSYQTFRKRNLERHVQCHKTSSDTRFWQCETCGGKYNKFHVTRHQRICVGQKDIKLDPYDGEQSNK